MKIYRLLISVFIPFFLLILFASVLTSKPYLLISKGMYSSHDNVFFDHDYAVDRIAGYLNYRYDNLEFGVDEADDTVIMRQIEIDHMVDVKNLYTSLRIAAVISLIAGVILSYIVYKKNVKEFYKTFKNLYLAPMFFTMFLGTFFIIDFNKAFTAFHHIFFSNDDWLLYNTDVLIILLPINFWLVSASIILVLFSLSLGLIYYLNEKIIRKTLS